jgi:hypothetical protein
MQCNALQAVISLFLHSTNTPTQVVEMLAHAGLSIAPSSINSMIQHMSDEAQRKLKDILPGMLSMLAVDNLEIFLQTEQPTSMNGGKLASLATATSIPMQPGIQKDDLKLSERLWMESPLNQNRSPDAPLMPLSHNTLMRLSADSYFAPDDPRSIESLFAWHIRDILLSTNVESIPETLKSKFRAEKLGMPTARGQIPVVKTIQTPLRAMNISLSTVSGTAAVIDDMLRQGGAKEEDLETHLLLVHGDLGTGEKIQALQTSRRIEATARDRLQFVLFIIGWFHIMMHMADSLWRLYIEPGRPRNNQAFSFYSIFYLCSILRPREVGKLASKPGFRRTHNVVEHLLLATITDAWRLAVQKKHGIELSEWKPTWDEVVELSRVVLREYVADNLYRVSNGTGRMVGDQVKDQLRLFNRDALLYMAARRASRHGDIRRVEDLLIPWVYIWSETGKHKYAAYVTRFLTNLNYAWPAKLSEIVRRNWLVNPTGKKDGFRGVDWVVERNNFMHKCLYSGSSSNRTIEQLIKQSPLIVEYQRAHSMIEKNFYLTERTTRHPPPLMKHTLARVQHHLREHEMNLHQSGRKLPRAPKNAIAAGVTAAASKTGELWFAQVDGVDEEGLAGETEGEDMLVMTAGDIGVEE